MRTLDVPARQGVLILADDLTGAADSAVGFVRVGRATLVNLAPCARQLLGDDAVIAVDADTRRLSAPDAQAVVMECFWEHRQSGQLLYKKIDSTLRGQWAAEVAALQPHAGMAVVSPAHPTTGRVVQRGQVHVHGVPLAATDTWNLEHGQRPSGIREQLLEVGLVPTEVDADGWLGRPDALAAHLDALARGGASSVVVDAASEAALRDLARAVLTCREPVFCVGSGGLARELAALEVAREPVDSAPVSAPGGPVLFLVGSLSEVGLRQCAVLVEDGDVRRYAAPAAVLRGGPGHAQWDLHSARIGDLLDGGHDVLIHIERDAHFNPAEGASLAARLGLLIRPHFFKAGAAVLTGGESARAMLKAVDVLQLRLQAELEPGVSLGIPSGASSPAHPWIVTKAGAFGDDRTLQRIRSALRAGCLGPAPC